MHVLVATAPVGGLESSAAAEIMARAWLEAAPGDTVTALALDPGVDGLIRLAGGAEDARLVPITARDPWGEPGPATLVLVEDEGRRTAYVTGAEALRPADGPRDPATALTGTTAGVADLLQAALEAGSTRIVVGLERSPVLDGGAGLLAALGVKPAHLLDQGGLALADLANRREIDAGSLRAARDRFRDVELVVATDLDLPLLGFHGLAATEGAGLGLDPAQTQALESALGAFVDSLTRASGQRDLLTGALRRLDKVNGAGAGGGAAHALLHLGARSSTVSAESVALARLPAQVVTADLVVIGCDRFDWDTLRGGLVKEVADLAAVAAVPAVVVATDCIVGRREAMALGLSACYGVTETRGGPAAASGDPAGALADRMTRVARTWSPRR